MSPHHTSGDPALPWLLVAVGASALACAAWWAETYARGVGAYEGQ